MKPKIVGGFPQPIADIPPGEEKIGGGAKKYKNSKIEADAKKMVQKLKQKRKGGTKNAGSRNKGK